MAKAGKLAECGFPLRSRDSPELLSKGMTAGKLNGIYRIFIIHMI